MKRLAFLLGLAAGYVLGARAGRRSYEQIKAKACGLWNSAPVQKQVERAGTTIASAVPVVGGAAAKGVKKLFEARVERSEREERVQREERSERAGRADFATGNVR